MRRKNSSRFGAAWCLVLVGLLWLPRVRAEAPPDPEVCDAAGKKGQDEGKFRPAIEIYERMFKLEQRPVCMCALAEAACLDAELGQAQQAAKQCLENLPHSAIAGRVINCLKHLQHDLAPKVPPTVWYRRPWVWALTGSLVASVSVAVSLGILLRPKDSFLELGTITYHRQ